MMIPEVIKVGAIDKDIVGTLTLSKLPRLQAAVLHDEAEIKCHIMVSRSKETGRLLLDSQLVYAALLICQRCMQPYTEAIAIDRQFVAIKREAQAELLGENQEPVLALDGKINLFSMIEDELLLSLPMIPMHPEADCSVKLERISPKPSQFDILATLKKSGENHGCTKES